jgi:hypothetical protein
VKCLNKINSKNKYFKNKKLGCEFEIDEINEINSLYQNKIQFLKFIKQKKYFRDSIEIYLIH